MSSRLLKRLNPSKSVCAIFCLTLIAASCSGEGQTDLTGTEQIAEAEQAVLGVADAVTDGATFDRAVDSYQFRCEDLRFEGTGFILELPSGLADDQSAERASAYLKHEGFEVVIGGGGTDPAQVFVSGSKNGSTVGVSIENGKVRIDAMTSCYRVD